MTDVTIYHNPRCSKSRSTLALLEENGVSPTIVLYLEAPPSRAQIKSLLGKLGMSAAQLVRRGEDAYKAAGLSKESSEADMLSAMAEYPKLIERPIVVHNGKAAIGRPTESIEAILDS